MSIPNRWDALVQESGGALPSQLKQFQIDTQTLLEAGRHTLVSVPCGAGKTIIQANGSRVMGGGAVGLVIPPTLVIQHQMEQQMAAWGVKYLHLDKVDPDALAATLRRMKPDILLSTIERLENKDILSALLTIRLSYVAVEEAQVSDPLTGWTEIRPFHPDLWLHLSTAHSCPFLWSSATCGEAMLMRLCTAFGVLREDVAVLSMSVDRPNIYIQRRVTQRALCLGNIDKDLKFLLPIVCDTSKPKTIIFVPKRLAAVTAAWLREQAEYLARPHFTRDNVVKITGSNSSQEKARVMALFNEPQRASVLVASSCASMGFDVKDVRAVVNVGKPSSDWILSQQMGRAGRDGQQSVCINLSRAVRVTEAAVNKSTAGDQGQELSKNKGMSGAMKEVYANNKCSRIVLNSVYDTPTDVKECCRECADFKECCCSLCKCCSVCSNACTCAWSEKCLDTKLGELLSLTSADYMIVKAITASFTAMEDEVEEEESDEDIEESEEEENLVIPELDDKEGEGEMFGGWVWDERSLREELD